LRHDFLKRHVVPGKRWRHREKKPAIAPVNPFN
jgi:hypothetical protein